MATKAKTDLAKPLIEQTSEDAGKKEEVQGGSIAGFRFNVQLAMRTSAMVVLFSLPIFLPPVHDAIMKNKDWALYMAYIPGGVNLMVVFTVYANYGSTVQLFYQGLFGTAGACAWVTVMSAIMPNGAAGDNYYEPFAHFSNIVFCILMLWLNFSKNVRMFTLSYHVYFAMSFMNPKTPKGSFNTSWAFDFDSQATTTLLTAFVGLVGALIVMLVPKPILAKRAASDEAISATNSVCNLMDDLNEYFARSSPSVLIAQKGQQLTALRDSADAMSPNIDASWWETFDLVSGGLRRKLVARHVDLIKLLCDNMLAMQIAMLKEDFGTTHIVCMKKIAAQIDALLAKTRELLTTATACATVGIISDDKKAELMTLIDETRSTVTDLGQTFNKARKQMFPEKVINPDLQSESFFVYCLSAYARHAIEYTYLMMEKAPPRSSLFNEMKIAFFGLFDRAVLMNRLDVHGFTFRGSLTILGCYYIGLYYEGYNAVASGTVALLISDFPGSALQKNMGRIQAVVIGAVVPHILYMVMGTACSPVMISVRIAVLFLFETICCYIYYASSQFGYIGLLAAAFALSSLIYPCGPEPSEEAEQAFGIASFVNMTQTTLGVIIMTLVDTVLASERASDGAQKNLLKALMDVDMWFQGMFLDRDLTGNLDEAGRRQLKCRADIANDHSHAKKAVQDFHGQRQKGKIHNRLNLAKSLGKEADAEPRYQRAPWPTDFFEFQCHEVHVLRSNLEVTESILRGTKRKGVDSYADFSSIRSSPEWESVKVDVVNTMGNAIEMIQAILENETAKPLPHVMAKLTDLEGADRIEGMPELFKSINNAAKTGLKYPADKAVQSIEDDEICRLNVLLMLFDSNVEHVSEMVKTCLRKIES